VETCTAMCRKSASTAGVWSSRPASQHYLSGIGCPDGMPEQDYRAMMSQIVRSGIENHVKRAGEAREAMIMEEVPQQVR